MQLDELKAGVVYFLTADGTEATFVVMTEGDMPIIVLTGVIGGDPSKYREFHLSIIQLIGWTTRSMDEGALNFFCAEKPKDDETNTQLIGIIGSPDSDPITVVFGFDCEISS